jgi:hypothetical protein
MVKSITGPWTAGCLLAAFWVFLLSSLAHTSLTVDEIGHATAGATYWRAADYRLDPENGNLPQRVVGLSLAWGGNRFPALESDNWQSADVWGLGDEWFHHSGNHVGAMLGRGRAAMSLFAVALGALVWLWSRQLFGGGGGLLSLLLYILSPIVLANGALMTSDTCAALFFFASVWSLWRALQEITTERILTSGACVGALFISKLSAGLIGPIGLVLVFARLVDGRPLPVALGARREIRGRGRQALAFVALGAAQVVLVAIVIWGAYGFRYSAFAGSDAGQDHFYRPWDAALDRPDPLSLLGQLGLNAAQRAGVVQTLKAQNLPPAPWDPRRVTAFEGIRRALLTPAQNQRLAALLLAPPPAWPARLADWARRHHWLPEAYIYGYTYAWRFTQVRAAFLNGAYSLSGWWWFFPYVIWVKTPLTEFAIGALAIAAALAAQRRSAGSRPGALGPSRYEFIPCFALVGIYGLAALLSRFDLGNRHLLVIYPPLFVLCGAAAAGRKGAITRRRGWILTLLCLVGGLAAEVGYRYPHYLAYFNIAAGGPSHAYRHLVDSSLDWGQDLPGVRSYLDRHPQTGPVYFSYFGTASPTYYQIPAQRLFSVPGRDVPPAFKIIGVPVGQADAFRPAADFAVVGRASPADGQVSLLLLKKASALRLTGGTYLISATLLQPIEYSLTGPLGHWNDRFESIYQALNTTVKPLLADPMSLRLAALRQHSLAEWSTLLPQFDQFRFARLTAYLRRREPDDTINGSILIYHLSDADLVQALTGPPPELGPDLPTAYLADHAPAN